MTALTHEAIGVVERDVAKAAARRAEEEGLTVTRLCVAAAMALQPPRYPDRVGPLPVDPVEV